MEKKQTITVAIFEKETDKQVCFKQKETTNPAFDVAMTELTDYLDTICESKRHGAKEHFMVFLMVNKDNPTRIAFEVAYGPKMRKINWQVPEHIDEFPTNDFTPDGKRIFLDNFPQAPRFSTYEAINSTFENRIRVRINRRLGIHPETGWCSYDSVEPDSEPIDFVTRLAKRKQHGKRNKVGD